MKKQTCDFEVVYNKRLNEEYFLLKLLAEDDLPNFFPAQFVEVRIDGAPSTFLRRPISIHDVNYEKNSISLLVRIAGEGTAKLSEIKKTDLLNLVFPLGNSFSMPDTDNILLVGGGCGVAPMLYTAKYFMNFGFSPTFLLGYKNKESILRADKFAKYGNVFYATDDGSFGEKGNVLDHSLLNSDKICFDKIYACGPQPMLKAIGNFAIERKIECEVSLENLMACGIGACLCCVQNTTEGHKCVCTEGPVFDVKNIIW